MKKKLIIYSLMALTLLIAFWFSNRAMEGLRAALLLGNNLIEAIDGVWGHIGDNPFHLSTEPLDLAAAAGMVVLLVMIAGLNTKHRFRPGEEYGSARWGSKRDIAPYIDKIPDNNILLTKTERMTMDGRPKNPETARNKNVLVIGGPGSGKTRFYVKPNLMQCHSSYVVTDPKGTVMTECGKVLEQSGYKIRALNLSDPRYFSQSMKYNPFAYITSEGDILKLVDTLIANTSGKGERKEEDFWVKAERLYYCALIGYIWSEAEPEERNMRTMLIMLTNSEAREEDETYQGSVDILFNQLEQEKPTSFAVRQYKKYKQAAGKTAKSILISCGARLAPFDIEELLELMDYDELELDRLGEEKTALFVITSDTDKTFNFIAAMMYSQMFNLLCNKALEHGGRLPVHVRCILDEFANIGRIPNFEEIISVIRSREISASVILQSRAQLEGIYDKQADIIIDSCDTMLFLGGKGIKTLEEIVKLLGKQTIHNTSESKSRGSQKSDGTSTQGLGRELMTLDELAVMPRSHCICQINGVRPFYSEKYDLLKHPRYPLLSDADRRNTYLPVWIRDNAPPAPDEEFLFCDITDEELELELAQQFAREAEAEESTMPEEPLQGINPAMVYIDTPIAPERATQQLDF